MTRHPTRPARGLRRALITAVAAGATAISGLAFVAPSAHAAEPTLTASKTTNLAYEGETITVSGTGYEPGRDLHVTMCDTNIENLAAACVQSAPYISEATVAGNGTFSASLKVRGQLDLALPQLVDCHDPAVACAIATAAQQPPTDRSQDAFLPITFKAEAAPQPTLGLSNSAVKVGDTITVNGTKFPKTPTTLTMQICSGTKCDSAGSTSFAYDGSGTFSNETYDVTALAFQGVDCKTASCVLRVTGPDSSFTANAPITVAIPPKGKPTITLSKTAVKAGDTVTITGTDFPNKPTNMWVSICEDPPGASNCDMDMKHVDVVTYNGSGSFTKKFTIGSLRFMTGVGLIDCAKTQCVIGTANQPDPKNHTYDAWTQITVTDSSPAAAAPGKAKVKPVKVKKNGKVVFTWTKAKANGTPVTGYVVKVKAGKKAWKNAGKAKASAKKLAWKGTKGKYQVKVIAKSKAGNSSSKPVKFTIK